MQQKSLSRKLLTKVLSVYFILTFVVTLGQIVAEYFNTKNHINGELATLQQTISGSLTRAIWELNTCLLYTSPSPRDGLLSRMPSSA